MKLFFIGTSVYILYLMKGPFRPTHDPNLDTFKVEYLLIASFVLSLIFNYAFTFSEVSLVFQSIPQLTFRSFGHSVSGSRASLFFLNYSSSRGQGKPKQLQHITYLPLARIERYTFPIGSIDILLMITLIPSPLWLDLFR